MKQANDIISELGRVLGAIDGDKANELAYAILNAGQIFVAGAGRSGFMTKAFAMRLMHMNLNSCVVGETTTPGIAAGDLLVIGSGSGSTASLRVAAEKAKQIGATIALITIDDQSPIAQLADIVLTIPAPSPKVERDTDFQSVQPMGSLFEQALLLTFDALILLLMQKRGDDSDNMFTRHANLE